MSRLAPHLILTLGRSGSNTLSDILNQNPEIFNYAEVLGAWNAIRKAKTFITRFSGREDDYIDRILYDWRLAAIANVVRTIGKIRKSRRGDIKRFSDIRTIGIKDFSQVIRDLGLTEHLLAKSDLRFIGLVRRNCLDRYLSGVRMTATQEVAIRENQSRSTVTLELDPTTLVRELTIIQDEHDELDAMLARVPDERKFLIDYDDLYGDPERTLLIARNIYDFLGVRPVAPQIRMKKIVQVPPSELIANFDACRLAVAGTPFARYFD